MSKRTSQKETFDPEDLAALAREWFRLFNQQDASALVNLHSKNAKHYSPKLKVRKPETKGVIQGRAELKRWWQDAFDTIEGLRYEIQRITAQANRVVVEYIRHATNAEDMEVVEVYEVEKVRGKLRILTSRVYHG